LKRGELKGESVKEVTKALLLTRNQ
jgi:hypothetical protein